MVFIYNLLIRLYCLFIKTGAIFNTKAKLWIDGRKDWEVTLSQVVKPNQNWVWFHCSSYGEFEDFSEILRLYKSTYPTKKIVLTFYSPSGYEALKHTSLADHVMYMPLDTNKNANQFLNILQPEMAFFSRSDLWHNFLQALKNRKINIFLVSLSLTSKSAFLKWPQRLIYKKCFESFTQIYCQTSQTKRLLSLKFNLSNSIITGNTRIDRIIKTSNDKTFSRVELFINNSFCVIAGSCLEKDEQSILTAVKELSDYPIKWLIVPHEISSKKIDLVIEQNSKQFTKYSTEAKELKNFKVMYVDFVGGLKHLYKYTNYAVIGGGFNKIGIHNIIEPSVFGIETAFGPNHRNYPEAIDLMKLGAATTYSDSIELIDLIKYRYNNPRNTSLKNDIKNYVYSNGGGSKSIITDLEKFIK